MDLLIGIFSMILLISAGFIGLFSFLTMINVLVDIQNFDELERKVVYETFAISFCIIILVHLIQLILSFTKFDLSYLVSAGGFWKGGLISNSPLHIDSFILDMFILGIVYHVEKKRYGLK